MNRFKQDVNRQLNIGMIGLVIFPFFLSAGMAITGIINISDQAEVQQMEQLREVINRDMVNCYALEGRYPQSLDYMKEHYGLTYNEKKFFVDYEIIGANLMPEIRVTAKRARGSGQ